MVLFVIYIFSYYFRGACFSCCLYGFPPAVFGPSVSISPVTSGLAIVAVEPRLADTDAGAALTNTDRSCRWRLNGSGAV
jgi:hypothetical protein